MIASASFSIGEYDVKSMSNFIPDYEPESDENKKFIDPLYIEYRAKLDKIVTAFYGIMYGTFVIKYLYDMRKNNKAIAAFSRAEIEYYEKNMSYGHSIFQKHLNTIIYMVEDYMKIGLNVYKGYNSINSLYPSNDKSIVLPIDVKIDVIENSMCRILTLPSIYKICVQLRNFADRLQVMDNSVKTDTFVGESLNLESDTKIKSSPFKNLFSLEGENFINKFVGSNCRIGGDIKKFCDNLIIDTEIAIESDNDTLIAECVRKAIVLNGLRNKNPSPDNLTIARETLKLVSDKFSNTNK